MFQQNYSKSELSSFIMEGGPVFPLNEGLILIFYLQRVPPVQPVQKIDREILSPPRDSSPKVSTQCLTNTDEMGTSGET